MGDPGVPLVAAADHTAVGLAPTAILDPVILRFAVLTYLVVLPVGHLFAIPVNGTMATGSDVFLALILLAGIVDFGRWGGRYLTGGERLPLLPGARAFNTAARFIMAFSAWVALTSAWSSNPAYAVTKGLAFVAVWRWVGKGRRCVAPGDPG